jgi:hypothetical protein
MTATTLHHSWETIAGMGQTMQQLANDSDWPGIADLARRRHESVTLHFQRYPVSPDNAEFYHQHLHHFFQQEQLLNEIVNCARKNVLKDANLFGHNRRAISAYKNVIKPSRST